MLRRNKPQRSPAAVLWVYLLLCGCNTSPLKRPEIIQLRDAPRLVRLVSVEVDCDEKLGPAAEWEQRIATICNQLDVATLVWPSSDKTARPDADVSVRVTLRRDREEQPTDVDTQGAVLGTIAWLTIPLVPMWISDVYLDSGVAVTVSGEVTSPGADSRAPEHSPGMLQFDQIPAMQLQTCMRERYPFFSWQTLGLLLAPPFLFQNGDPDHIREALQDRIKDEVAVAVATVIKKSKFSEELLTDVRVQRDDDSDTLEVIYQPGADIGVLRLASSRETQVRIVRSDLPEPPPPLKVTENDVEVIEDRRIVRLEAVSRDFWSCRYSVLVPPVDSSTTRGEP